MLKDKATFTQKNMVKVFVVCELNTWSRDLNSDFTFKCWLLRSVKLTNNADPDKCKCSGYDIIFDSCSEFLLPDGSMGENAQLHKCLILHNQIKNFA